MPLLDAASGEPLLAATLAAIREDTSRAAGALFVDLACRHLEEVAAPIAHPPGSADILARFAEPPALGRPLAEVVSALERDVVEDCLHLGHPGCLCAPIGSPLPAAAWCESLIGATNQSLRMWSMSPVGTALEIGLIGWMARLIGWSAGAGGSFTSGATESNLTALLAARARALPHAWRDGIDEAPVVLAGENVHFSVARALAAIGLGSSALVTVALRDQRMDPRALEARLRGQEEAGRRVMAVVATAGALATGAFDDLDAIGRVCDAHGVWLHVDAAIGGGALLSSVHRRRLRGIERARSVAWDLHKLALLPLAAGVLLVRSERDLEAAFGGAGDERSWDQVGRTLVNSRRLDALKLWVALQRYGAAGLGAIYDQLCGLAEALHREVCARPDFEPLHRPDSSLLVFRYLGRGPRPEPALDSLNRRLAREALVRGHAFLSAPVVDRRAGLLAVMTDPFLTAGDIARLLDGLSELGASLEAPGGEAT